MKPSWLFLTIVSILLFHYVFLGSVLILCVWGIRENFQKLIIMYDRAITDQELRESLPAKELGGFCLDIDDQWRNARNKAIEIILALLVPTSTVVGNYYMKRKKEDITPLDDDPKEEQP